MGYLWHQGHLYVRKLNRENAETYSSCLRWWCFFYNPWNGGITRFLPGVCTSLLPLCDSRLEMSNSVIVFDSPLEDILKAQRYFQAYILSLLIPFLLVLMIDESMVISSELLPRPHSYPQEKEKERKETKDCISCFIFHFDCIWRVLSPQLEVWRFIHFPLTKIFFSFLDRPRLLFAFLLKIFI